MIAFSNVYYSQGQFSFQDLSFEIPTGQYTVLMGSTGCGKTTILELLAGLKRPITGNIVLNQIEITKSRPSERQIGYVPQDRALFDTYTVEENLAFALRLRHVSKKVINEQVESISSMLGIAHLLKRFPQGLSGGEAQRVALGRALIFKPKVLCLDEPLSALDESTHENLCSLLKDIHNKTKITVLHVTHSSKEAKKLAQRILYLENGVIKE